MALLDDILGMVGNKEGANNILGVITHLMDESGGLNGLLKKFQDSGLSEVVGSWVGLGENQKISADSIMQVIGSGKIQQLAQQFGLDHNQFASQIAGMLPQVIDSLTPEGKVPDDNNVLGQALEVLKSNFLK
ncbi:YidB family protein [Pseudanabaena sp. PCC 6802]|uniref:YidB family protein n=1 Tax=Pseudanabaena sp. PCC 6802 TaxID=118173 RepID=UPI00034658CF|nr:YidB family protein [Pseudanabaena sp. PCC 6802]